ncbi:hypothetical protein D3C75_1238570 [compost metagenome]
MPFGVETHGAALYQVLHFILVNVGIHLPAAGINQNADRFTAVNPLAGLAVAVQIQPLPGERCLQGQALDLRTRRTGFFELHIEALACGDGLVGP